MSVKLITAGPCYSTDSEKIPPFNSLARGRFLKKIRKIVLKLNLVTDGCDISSEIAHRWTSLDLSDDKSTLVQVMAWCRQATSHYLNQCWPKSLPPYGVTRSFRWPFTELEAWACRRVKPELVDGPKNKLAAYGFKVSVSKSQHRKAKWNIILFSFESVCFSHMIH